MKKTTIDLSTKDMESSWDTVATAGPPKGQWGKIAAIIGGCILAITSIFYFGIGPAPPRVNVDEQDYQSGIQAISGEQWDKATILLVLLHNKKYKDAETLFNYASSKKYYQKSHYGMAGSMASQIPDDYAGSFAGDIKIYKKDALAKKAAMTSEDKKRENEEVDAELGITRPKPDLEITETHSVNEQYSRYAAGTVVNNTDNTYSYVQVEINLYDASGAQVGSTLDNTNNLEPGGTWKFKALIFEDEARRFRVIGVTGF